MWAFRSYAQPGCAQTSASRTAIVRPSPPTPNLSGPRRRPPRSSTSSSWWRRGHPQPTSPPTSWTRSTSSASTFFHIVRRFLVFASAWKTSSRTAHQYWVLHGRHGGSRLGVMPDRAIWLTAVVAVLALSACGGPSATAPTTSTPSSAASGSPVASSTGACPTKLTPAQTEGPYFKAITREDLADRERHDRHPVARYRPGADARMRTGDRRHTRLLAGGRTGRLRQQRLPAARPPVDR